jgi:hypothetical protein
MSISRLFVLLLSIAASVVPVTAQSSSGRDSATSQLQLKAPSDSSDRIHVDQFRLPSDSALLADSHKAVPIQAAIGPMHRLLSDAIQGEDSVPTCYSMRSYKVARDDPQSDATKPAGYSTCQAAKRFQMKSIEDSPELIKP